MGSIRISELTFRRVLVSVLIVFVGYAVFISHVRLLFDLKSGPHLPGPGLNQLGIGLGPLGYLLLSWTAVLGLAAALFLVMVDLRHKVVGSAIAVAGGIALFLQLLTTEERLVFSYFPAFALMAAGQAWRSRSHFPLAALVGSLYLSAATHKLLNFSKMLVELPAAIHPEISRALVASESNIDTLLLILSYAVVPFEFILGALMISSRWRAFSFSMALFFHSALVILTNNGVGLGFVGFAVLFAHLLNSAFLLSQPLQAKRKSEWLFVVLIVFWGIFEGLRPKLEWIGWAWAIGLYFPMAYLNLKMISLEESNKVTLGFSQTLARLFRHKIWTTTLLLWFLYPVSIDYRSQQFGWAMFSGASSDRSAMCIVVAPSNCFEGWRLRPQVRTIRSQEEVIFVSRQMAHLDIIKRQLQDRCGLSSSTVGEINKEPSSHCKTTEP